MYKKLKLYQKLSGLLSKINLKRMKLLKKYLIGSCISLFLSGILFFQIIPNISKFYLYMICSILCIALIGLSIYFVVALLLKFRKLNYMFQSKENKIIKNFKHRKGVSK